MTDPIDLGAERNRRVTPDADCINRDEYGRPLYLFTASYRRADGGEYGVHFWAYDLADAQAAVAGMNTGMTLDGQVYRTVLHD